MSRSPAFAMMFRAATHHQFPTASVGAGEGSSVRTRRALQISHQAAGIVPIGMNEQEVSNTCLKRM
jgi:hypothetical protein